MNEVKKSSFFRNRSFCAKKRFKMQSYLNEMSASGLHINKIGKNKCHFNEDITARFLYSICGDGEEELYTEDGDWVHFCNYKGVPFFKRPVPNDAVKLHRTYKKNQAKIETGWLNARLREGLALIGRVGDEYIFRRTEEFSSCEYVVKHIEKPKKTKDGQIIPPLGDTSGLLFLTTNDDGSVYYFLKDASAKLSVTKNRGKRLSDQIFSIIAATGSAIGFCASAILAVFGLIKSGTFMLPLLIVSGVCAVLFAAVFVIYFRRFQKISEARRIRKEEIRLKKEANAKANAPKEDPKQELPPEEPKQKPADPANNTVVMNTVVMNNYGDQKKRGKKLRGTGVNSSGQLSDDTDGDINPALDPSVNPAIANDFAQSVIDNIRYGDAADTLYQGEEDDEDWRPEFIAPPATATLNSPSETVYADEEWVATESDGDDTDTEEQTANEPVFPLGMFVFAFVSCFTALMAMIFGMRYGIGYFISFGKQNILTLLFSVLGVAFSPFAFRFGLVQIIDILKSNSARDDAYDEDDYEEE